MINCHIFILYTYCEWLVRKLCTNMTKYLPIIFLIIICGWIVWNADEKSTNSILLYKRWRSRYSRMTFNIGKVAFSTWINIWFNVIFCHYENRVRLLRYWQLSAVFHWIGTSPSSTYNWNETSTHNTQLQMTGLK